MADSREEDPLLPDDDVEDSTHVAVSIPAEAPPAYEVPKWTNPQPVGSSALADIVPPSPREAPPAFDAVVTTETSFGLRRVHLTRTSTGFGITVRGNAPVRIVEVEPGSEAEQKGLKPNDRIMEVNSEDVTYASVMRVSNIISSSQEIYLAVLTGLPENTNTVQPAPDGDINDLWSQAFRSLDVGALDPTQEPPSNLGPAVLSMFCCPVIGCAAVWHASQVHDAFQANNVLRARGHSYMAKRLASNAVFYGIVGIVLFLFVRLNDHVHS